MSSSPVLSAAAVAWGLAVAPVYAQNPGVHTHGEADMDVIVDGASLSIALRAPGADIVGFEHHAETAADRKAVSAALAVLEDAAKAFALPGAAKCRVAEAHAESSLLAEEKADHGHGHKHGRKDAHAADHAEGHGGFTAHYAFDCAAPKALDGFGVRLFELFPSLREVRVRVIGPAGQSAAALTASRTSVAIRR